MEDVSLDQREQFGEGPLVASGRRLCQLLSLRSLFVEIVSVTHVERLPHRQAVTSSGSHIQPPRRIRSVDYWSPSARRLAIAAPTRVMGVPTMARADTVSPRNTTPSTSETTGIRYVMKDARIEPIRPTNDVIIQ